EGAPVDQELAEAVVLLLGAVAPLHPVGCAQGRHLVDPGQQLLVRRPDLLSLGHQSSFTLCQPFRGGNPGVPMSTSEPNRSLWARPASLRSKTTRWPWRSMRKTDPVMASVASSYSLRSVSRTRTPSLVPGSYALMTPCKRPSNG